MFKIGNETFISDFEANRLGVPQKNTCSCSQVKVEQGCVEFEFKAVIRRMNMWNMGKLTRKQEVRKRIGKGFLTNSSRRN